MKHAFRRMMSMVLTLSMITSMIGVMPAFAAEPDTHPTNGGSAWQIKPSTDGYAYHVVGEDTKGTTTTDDDVKGADGAVNTAEGGKVSVSKTIAPTGTEDEFIITLKVETLQELSTLNISADAAVVLVIDNSSSMYQNTTDKLIKNAAGDKKDSTIMMPNASKWENGKAYVALPADASDDYFDYVDGGKTFNNNKYIPYIENGRIPLKTNWESNDEADWRITKAKNAADSFADAFLNDENTTGNRYLSVVSFSTTAKTECDWTKDYDTASDAIDAMRPINMTYMSTGLNKASQLLDDPTVSSYLYKYVILLADGAASDPDTSKTAATNVNNKANTDLYTVSFAGSNAMSGYAGTPMTAANGAQLIARLADIQQKIETATQAYVVTDPMGENIEFVADSQKMIACSDINANNPSFVTTDDGFTWDLKLVNPDEQDVSGQGGITHKYVYTLQYGITLDTDPDSDTFECDTYYLTNGYTRMPYAIKTTNSSTGDTTLTNGTIDFNVPAVCGELPDYNYTVNHWKQAIGGETEATTTYNGKEYVSAADSETRTFVKNGIDTVEMVLNSLDDNYHYAGVNSDGGSATANETDETVSVVVSKAGQIVDIYYDYETANATATHYFYTFEQTPNAPTAPTLDELIAMKENGTATWDETEVDSQNGIFLDSSVTFLEWSDIGDYVCLTNEAGRTVTVTKDGDNHVDIYYLKVAGELTPATLTVNHVYREYEYVLDEATERMKLQLVEYKDADGNPTTTNPLNRHFSVDGLYIGSTGCAPAIEEKNDYSYDEFTPVGSDAALNAAGTAIDIPRITVKDNEITIYYEKMPDPLVEIPVTVNHVYEYQTKYYDAEGNLQTAAPKADDFTHASTTVNGYHAGDTFNASEYIHTAGQYDVNYGTGKTPAGCKLNDVSATNNEITIYYLRTLEPVTVNVNHEYTLYRDIINDDGEFVEKKLITDSTDPLYVADYSETVTEYNGKDIYPESTFVATTNAQGYGIDSDVADYTITSVKESGNEVTIQYSKYVPLNEAAVDYEYIYTYNTWNYNEDGILAIVDTKTYVDGNHDRDGTISGHDGESYVIEQKPELNSVTYEALSFSGNNVNGKLKTGDRPTITMKYKYDDYSQIEAAGVKVNYHYETITYTVNLESDARELVSTGEGVYTTKTMYEMLSDAEGNTWKAGMIYDVDKTELVPDDEFSMDTTAENVISKRLVAGDNNTLDVYYTRSIYPTPVEIEVIHHYGTYTVTAVGGALIESEPTYTTSSTDTIPAEPPHYAGQFFDATPKPNGFEQKTAASEYTDQLLAEGKNTYHIYYANPVQEYENATLVVHYRYTTEYTNGDADKVTEKRKVLEIKNSYETALQGFVVNTKKDRYEVTGVTFNGAAVDKDTRTVTLDAGKNIVWVDYYRLVENRTPVDVTVNHFYSVKDLYTNVVTPEGNNFTTDTLWLEDVSYEATLQPSHDPENDEVYLDYNYLNGEYACELNLEEALVYTAFEDDSTTIALTENGDYVINLYYQRTVDTTPPPIIIPSYYTLTVNWVDEDGNALASQQKTSGYTYTAAYETTQKAFDGYTFLKMSDSSDPASGIMNGNRTVTYVYTAVTDIPEVDPPLTEIPDEPDVPTTPPAVDIPEIDIPLTDIPEIEIPLTDVPQTGDTRNIALYAAIAMMSAIGLAWLTKTEYDEKKRTEN